jgi:hypothetical protein
MPTSSVSSETLHTVTAQELSKAAQPEAFYEAKEALPPAAKAEPIDTLSQEAPINLQESPAKATPVPKRPLSVKRVKPTILDADAISFKSAKSEASAHSSATSSFYAKINSEAESDTSSSRSSVSARPAPGVPSDAAAAFSVKVAALAKQTKVARNVMPMVLRGGVIAGMGMLLFGHLAPLAIVGVLVGALLGGYLVAKAMQLVQARKFAAMGDANPIEQLKRDMPSDASQADVDKFNTIVNFIEKGDVFEAGFVKAFREPYRAAQKRVGNAMQAYQAKAIQGSPAAAKPVAQQPKEPLLDDAASDGSGLSEAEKYKKSVLEGEAFVKADPQAESEPLLKKAAAEI